MGYVGYWIETRPGCFFCEENNNKNNRVAVCEHNEDRLLYVLTYGHSSLALVPWKRASAGQTTRGHVARRGLSAALLSTYRPLDVLTDLFCCCCCCCLHIINHPGLSTQHLLLSQPLRTNSTLDSADFRGHRLTYLGGYPA